MSMTLKGATRFRHCAILPAVKGALYGLRMLWESIYHESAEKELP